LFTNIMIFVIINILIHTFKSMNYGYVLYAFEIYYNINIKGMIIITPDKRLLKCADMVIGNGKVCDVGTDHAYLSAYLVQQKICNSVIASDIADGPLEAAQITIDRLGLSDKITLIKSDGLKNIGSDGVTDVIIAGMGAETISAIINDAKWLRNNINIIIQPMTKIPFMRKWLYENKFEIIKEEAVSDEGFIYTIMNIRYSGYHIQINETFANAGKFDYSDKDAKKFGEVQINRLRSISKGISQSDPKSEKVLMLRDVCLKISDMISGNMTVTVEDVYNQINEAADFSTQDSWDNSGLLVGNMKDKVTGILVTLDITDEVIKEALAEKANLIVSHHPVIFHPLKNLSLKNPAVKMAAAGIAAICVHTPIDMAVNGINDLIIDLLRDQFKLDECIQPIIPLKKGSSAGTGRICEISGDSMTATQMAAQLKKIFGCKVIRYTNTTMSVKKIAICSGSGGSLLGDVIENECQAYITGDIKHDIWIEAANNNIALFDCGHFYTETIVAEYITKLLQANIMGIKIISAKSNIDVVSYEI